MSPDRGPCRCPLGHRCEPWVALGIHCPEGLLEPAQLRAGIGEGPPDDEVQKVHEKSEAPVPADGFELERMVFIELERQARAQNKKTTRQRVVERLRERDRGALARPVLSPAEVKAEAVRSGETGPHLTVWLAAALAVLAAGGAAALAFPRWCINFF